MNTPPTWRDLYEAAKSRYNPRTISPFIEAGGVAAAILTDRRNVYTGVCIDRLAGAIPPGRPRDRHPGGCST